MYYSYVEIEYVATSFSPARMDLALKLLMAGGVGNSGSVMQLMAWVLIQIISLT